MKKAKQILLFLTMLAFVHGCAQNASDKAINKPGIFGRKLISREKALIIAKEYLLGKGKVISEKNFDYLLYDEVEAWERFRNFETKEVAEIVLQFHNEKRLFWLIWFCPLKQEDPGFIAGGTIVCVDRTTGQVLYEGEGNGWLVL